MNISSSSDDGEVLRARTVVIGDPGVGKSALIRNFIYGPGNDIPNHVLPYSDISEKSWQLSDGRTVRMTILDTAGLERYRSLTASYYRGIHSCLIVFDVGKMSSFDNVSTWFKDLSQYTSDQERISTILVGTIHKSSKRVITTDKAFQLAQYLGIPYMEVNLQVGNAADVFERLGSLIFERFQRRCSVVSLPTTIILPSEHKASWCSC